MIRFYAKQNNLCHKLFKFHYHRHADANFGVTTPVWDVLLDTRYAYDRKK